MNDIIIVVTSHTPKTATDNFLKPPTKYEAAGRRPAARRGSKPCHQAVTNKFRYLYVVGIFTKEAFQTVAVSLVQYRANFCSLSSSCVFFTHKLATQFNQSGLSRIIGFETSVSFSRVKQATQLKQVSQSTREWSTRRHPLHGLA